MRVQYCWLSYLPLISSAIAHVYLPARLKPRYLASGTGISILSTGEPPYPTATGTANSSAISTSPTITSTAIPILIPSSESFYLLVANIGSEYDGDYLSIGSDTSGNRLLVLYPGSEPSEVTSFSTFNINADGTLQNAFAAGIANIFPGGTYGTLFFRSEAYVDGSGNVKRICGTIGENLTCRTGADVFFFFICPLQVISGTLVDGTMDGMWDRWSSRGVRQLRCWWCLFRLDGRSGDG